MRFVDEPDRVTAAQMDRRARDFDNRGICDTVCFHLFERGLSRSSHDAQIRPDSVAQRPRWDTYFTVIDADAPARHPGHRPLVRDRLPAGRPVPRHPLRPVSAPC